MVLKCKKCGKEYMGVRAKQSIRSHIRGAHLIAVDDVLKSELVEVVNIDHAARQEKTETSQTLEIKGIEEKQKATPGTNKNVILITEALEMKCSEKMRQALLLATKKGKVAVNIKTGELFA